MQKESQFPETIFESLGITNNELFEGHTDGLKRQKLHPPIRQ